MSIDEKVKELTLQNEKLSELLNISNTEKEVVWRDLQESFVNNLRIKTQIMLLEHKSNILDEQLKNEKNKVHALEIEIKDLRPIVTGTIC